MTHRDRALTALSGKIPDRVPHFELVFHETERDFCGRNLIDQNCLPLAESGLDRQAAYEHNVELYLDIARKFEHDLIYVTPLEWPYWSHVDDVVEMLKRLREKSGNEFCLMAPGDPTFKIPGNPMAFAEKMYDAPQKLHEEAKRQLELAAESYEKCFNSGADGVIMTSDYAMNSGPFMSPEAFAEFVAPYLKMAVHAAHGANLLVIKHSDGNLMPVIEQIVDSGIDALHSLDPMAGMDIKAIKEKYGSRICLCGNVHCAFMQTGTREQIQSSAEYCLTHGKPGGGYIFSTSNCVFRGMPLESYDLIHKIWMNKRDY